MAATTDSSSSSFTLPPPAADQTLVTVSAIPAGFITLSDHFFVHPAEPGAKRTVPSLAFLITHPGPAPSALASPAQSQPFRLMFDLGLRSRISRYQPVMQKHLDDRAPFKLEPGAAEQLEAGGLRTADINAVLLSHVHYDHHGDPEDFPDSTFVVGHGALDVLAHGLTGKGSHQHFEADLLKHNKIVELPSPEQSAGDLKWNPLGPFPAALDLMGDGSIFILDTPGHLPGHLNLLCRVGPRKWLCLCGDSFHDPRLLTGEKEIGTWDSHGQTMCIHLDKEKAKESIDRLRKLQTAMDADVELIAAHDEAWLERHKGAVFPGHI